jgi:NADH:ubiquinone oxidoreductase subunit K
VARSKAPAVRDDAVLPATRVLSVAIVPFLVVAFVVLYLFPAHTDRLFAWTITSPMTAMVLGAVYLGGAYFFVRAATAREFHPLNAGFGAVTTFATLMGIATIIHWDKFNHDHVAFWLWVGLYFTTPFLVAGVWLANRRRMARPTPGDLMLGRPAQAAVGAVGALALGFGISLFVAPTVIDDIWPWGLTPLTARVLAAVLALGAAGIGVVWDRRWSAVRLMLQVEVLMLALILLAAVRARDEFDAGATSTWVFLIGSVGACVGALGLWVVMDRRAGTTNLATMAEA